ncbi:fibrillarin-like rRNA/tRNA 2'-O-methyltransferase [Candidatus Micrarchaeota archaeon]|nr:fibrillarin-like rRNA/tRNA 2'-O-methyltransferase [Candidatus Micrarchaeota archaeon]
MEEKFFGVYKEKKYIYTENLNLGRDVYGEKLIRESGKEYRSWDPFRSKLAAAMMNGIKTWPFTKNSKILYLGASTGTTVSHLSDICIDGEIFSVEISGHIMEKLISLSEKRENIIPILADASQPHEYKEVGEVDIIYEDVAQPNQAEIIIKNAEMFLKKGGIAFFAIKSQSIDVLKKPEEVFEQVKKELTGTFEIIEEIKLEPYDKDHLFLVLRKV